MISKVKNRRTGLEYALKTIQLEKISSKLAKEMRNEIEILKRLDHPNIIRESRLHFTSAIDVRAVFSKDSTPPNVRLKDAGFRKEYRPCWI